MKQRNTSTKIKNRSRIYNLENEIEDARTEFLDLIKQVLNEQAGTRKQYRNTALRFGSFPVKNNDKPKPVLSLKEVYLIKDGKETNFKIGKVLQGLKNYYSEQ